MPYSDGFAPRCVFLNAVRAGLGWLKVRGRTRSANIWWRYPRLFRRFGVPSIKSNSAAYIRDWSSRNGYSPDTQRLFAYTWLFIAVILELVWAREIP